MVTIIAIDKEGKDIGKPVKVHADKWKALQKFGKKCRWKLVEKKESKSNIKKEENEREKRSGTGDTVK